MSEIVYIIPTCNRAAMLNENLGHYPKKAHKIALINGCNSWHYYTHVWPKDYFTMNTINSGEIGLRSLYNTVAHGLGMAARAGNSVAIIEDDCIPIADIHDKLKRFTSGKNIINLLNIPKRDAYYYAGEYGRRRKGYDSEFDEVTWIDGNFFIPAEHVEGAQKQLLQSAKIARRFDKSSGVGRILSHYFLSRNFTILQPKKTWLAHGDHDSVLFRDGRKKVPLIAKFD